MPLNPAPHLLGVPQPENSPGLLHAPLLNRTSWLRHAFSTRAGGVSIAYGRKDDLNLGLTQEDDPAAVQENRSRLIRAISRPGDPPWTLATARQTHTTTTLIIPPAIPPSTEADGLLTQTSGILLGIFTADCVPILLADTRHRAVASIHAGWRGTAARILERAVQTMQDQFASRPEDLVAAIGPAIGPCCYQVGDEVKSAFHQAFSYAPDLFRRDHLDLWQANRHQLLNMGIPSANISIQNLCTASTFTSAGNRLFFSHRAEQGRTGRMVSLIGIVPDDPLP